MVTFSGFVNALVVILERTWQLELGTTELLVAKNVLMF
jgi:hypothetical protein